MRRAIQGQWFPNSPGATGAPVIVRMWVVIPALLCLGSCLLMSACASPGRGVDGEDGYVLFPPPPEKPRIQFLTSYSNSLDVLPPLSGFRRFVVGEQEGRPIGKPYGVAIHDGQILVCDTAFAVIEVFDLKARTFEILGGGQNGRLGKPINVSVDEDGTRYVADTILNRVMIYDRSNRFLRAFGEPDKWSPTDVAIVGERLYVTDRKNGQVVVMEKATGQEIRRMSKLGAGKDELFLPTNVAVNADGDVYVSDTGNFRVQKFDSRGRHLRRFGKLGKRFGQFVRPKGIALDREGRLYAVDAASEVVQIFDPEGQLLVFFGGEGNHPGGLNLPAKVVVDYDNVDLFADLALPGYEIEYLVIVTSQYGPNKVNVFGFLKESQNGGN